MTDEPRISDEEVNEFIVNERDLGVRQALAAFLRARVPGANPMYYGKEYHKGFNACRDQVLKGREDGK